MGEQKRELAEFYLERGASVNMTNGGGTSLLHMGVLACNSGGDAVLHQGGKGAPLDMYEASSHELAMVQLLVKHGADLESKDDDKHFTPLIYAARYSCVKVLKLLIDAGASINTRTRDGKTALHYTTRRIRDAEGGHPKAMTEILINRGALLHAEDEDGYTPLYGAVRFGTAAGAKALLDHGANVHWRMKASDESLLHFANGGQAYKTAKLLISHGADPDARDKNGRTPLLVAIQKSQGGLLDALLEISADVNARDASGKTVLDAALEFAPAIAESLVSKGAKTRDSQAGQVLDRDGDVDASSHSLEENDKRSAVELPVPPSNVLPLRRKLDNFLEE